MARHLAFLAALTLLIACGGEKIVSEKDDPIPDEEADVIMPEGDGEPFDMHLSVDDEAFGDEGATDEDSSPDDGDLSDDVPLDADIVYMLIIESPQEKSAVFTDVSTQALGKTNCYPSTISVSGDAYTADEPFWSPLSGDASLWRFFLYVSFDAPGPERILTVRAEGEACLVEDTVTVRAQSPLDGDSETRESHGVPFTVTWMTVPTVDPTLHVVVLGSDPPLTLGDYVWYFQETIAVMNGGFHDPETGLFSYWKGYLVGESGVWDSPVGNSDGPRSCLVERAGDWYIELSMGRDPVNGEPLLTDASQVLCGGPRLVENGVNVAEERYLAEKFEEPALEPYEEVPRTAACVAAEGSLIFAAAFAKETRFGMTLADFADYLLEIGCNDALNLDGGDYGDAERLLFNAITVSQSLE